MRVKKIFIITTYDCNLRCKYCFEHNKTKMHMDVDSMQHILHNEFSSDKKYELYSIILHGGEPFLAFNEIKELCEWTWDNYSNYNIQYSATTNGTVTNDEIKKWLSENKNRFHLILSIDGKREYHNLNRGNSFDKIDFDFFLSTYNRPWVKMTVAPNTLDYMYENFLYLQKMGFSTNPTLACETEWNKENDLRKIKETLYKLVQYYLSNPLERPGDLLSLPIEKIITNKDIYTTRCSLGDGNVAYDVKGNRYPCQNFIADFLKPYDKEGINECFSLICQNDYRKITDVCTDCIIKEICSPCYGLNFLNRGSMGSVDKVWCSITKVLVYFNAYLLSKALLKKEQYIWLRNKNDVEIATLAMAVKKINSLAEQLL
ncbi:MAG: 4Fe-4S cluster-binding domain-containing protein [Bacteroidaceae bacterium]|nr:4Fe-4S cluster-binding domain-containing protein [Bacteroidaceae bacterium]